MAGRTGFIPFSIMESLLQKPGIADNTERNSLISKRYRNFARCGSFLKEAQVFDARPKKEALREIMLKKWELKVYPSK